MTQHQLTLYDLMQMHIPSAGISPRYRAWVNQQRRDLQQHMLQLEQSKATPPPPPAPPAPPPVPQQKTTEELRMQHLYDTDTVAIPVRQVEQMKRRIRLIEHHQAVEMRQGVTQ